MSNEKHSPFLDITAVGLIKQFHTQSWSIFELNIIVKEQQYKALETFTSIQVGCWQIHNSINEYSDANNVFVSVR